MARKARDQHEEPNEKPHGRGPAPAPARKRVDRRTAPRTSRTARAESLATESDNDHTDALNEVGDALNSAIQRTGEAFEPDESGLGPIGRMAYGLGYGLAYGVVLPTMMVVHLIPKENAMVFGLVDGARAAREAVSGFGSSDPATEDESLAGGHAPEPA